MPRALYGLLAFLPLAGVVGTAIWTTVTSFGRPAREIALGPASITLPGLTLEEAIPIAVAIGVTALVQIATAIVFILHAQRHPGLDAGARIRWVLLVLFVGSIAQPIYWGLHVRSSPGRAPTA